MKNSYSMLLQNRHLALAVSANISRRTRTLLSRKFSAKSYRRWKHFERLVTTRNVKRRVWCGKHQIDPWPLKGKANILRKHPK
jgi:hypothetical protein